MYEGDIQSPQACPNCHSLFKRASSNRSCEDVAVSPNRCTCSEEGEFFESTSNATVLNAVSIVLDTLNQYLKKQENAVKPGTTCAVLKMRKVLSVRTRLLLGNVLKYILLVKVSPSEAIFETTWKSDGSPVKVEDISRVNMYNTQGDCVTGSSDLKKYCYCVNKR